MAAPKQDLGDRAGKQHWDSTWQSSALPRPFDPADGSVWYYPHRELARRMRGAIGQQQLAGRRFLEVGCARSIWLPYFAKELGFEVTGLDYSEIGCEQARSVLNRAGVRGEVLCADLRSPPTKLLGTFDVVASFGVMEHFEDTSAALLAASRLLAPSGLLITEIPNLVGVTGALQRVVNRPIYDIHVPLGADALAAAHAAAGLDVVSCDYAVFDLGGLLNTMGMAPGFRRSLTDGFIRLSRYWMAMAWAVDERLGVLRPNRVFSNYVLCVARRPAPGTT